MGDGRVPEVCSLEEMEMEMSVGTHEDGGRSHTRRLGNREERPGDAR